VTEAAEKLRTLMWLTLDWIERWILLALAQGNINASYSLVAANAPGCGTPENLVDTRGPYALAFSFTPRQVGNLIQLLLRWLETAFLCRNNSAFVSESYRLER
jgi:hypothetical protein